MPGRPDLRDNFVGRMRAALGWFSHLPTLSRRSILIKGLLAAAVAFVICMGVVWGAEKLIGNSLSCGIWAKCPYGAAPGIHPGLRRHGRGLLYLGWRDEYRRGGRPLDRVRQNSGNPFGGDQPVFGNPGGGAAPSASPEPAASPEPGGGPPLRAGRLHPRRTGRNPPRPLREGRIPLPVPHRRQASKLHLPALIRSRSVTGPVRGSLSVFSW